MGPDPDSAGIHIRSARLWERGTSHLAIPLLESVLQQHLHAYGVGKIMFTVVCIEKGT